MPRSLHVSLTSSLLLIVLASCGEPPSSDTGSPGGAGGTGGGSNGGSTTTGPTTGTGGGGPCESANPGTRTAPPFPSPAITTDGLLVRVMNNCPFPLWIHGQGNDGAQGQNTLMPDQAELATGQVQDYDAKATFGSARVTAYKDGPGQNAIQFVELNFGNGSLGYNISYVDYLGLPVEVTAACGTTACYAPVDGILEGCPTMLAKPDRCVSPGGWCNDAPNQADPYCTALDETAKQALDLPKCQEDLAQWLAGGHTVDEVGSTPSVYGCRDFWASSPFCCAVVNRGVVGAADPEDPCGFYQSPPYNTYAKWVHQRCPMIYAFAYDDAAEQSGYHQCMTNEIDITWCPGG